jgi:acetyl-CoA carboxylase biotin carboxyl carrier protein
MEIKQMKELMAAMARCGTTEFELKKGDFELRLKRLDGSITQRPGSLDDLDESSSRFAHQLPVANAPLPRGSDMTPAHIQNQGREEAHGNFITSPMVGTFYTSPSPEAPTFVKVGDKIEKGDVICIVEAMKVMNEIKAQSSGIVADILLESGTPVEFGTKLFRIE